jgi:hypothetical protein
MSLVLVDVEATGISPNSGVMTEFGAVEFKSRATFHGILWESEPDPENPAKPVVTGKHFDEEKVMRKFRLWLDEVSSGRPIFVSDNPAYDFMWITFYFDRHLAHNPFGHSGRRISDFWAGLQGDWYNTQKWKSLRVTKHDHNPVNDAMGNAEALATLIGMTKK